VPQAVTANMIRHEPDDLASEYRFDYQKSKPNRFVVQHNLTCAVILDMDGTILDTEEIDRRIWPAAAARCGFTLEPEFYETLVGGSTAAGEAALQKHFGASFSLPQFRTFHSQMWNDQLSGDGISVMPGAHELISFLENERIPFAIATSSVRENALVKLRAAVLDNRFAHLATADQVAAAKPAPDLYLAAAKLLGVPPAKCIAVEDSDNGALSAHAAGMTVLLIPDRKTPSPEAKSAAFKILRTLHEVPDTLRLLMQHAKPSTTVE
jgi:HAD superfamily hydrolase (TIGR01509 family)